MIPIRAITVCVEYSDILALTLPYNLDGNFFTEILIITAPTDHKTIDLCLKLKETFGERVRVHVTDAFYRFGAIFNKFMALEEGLDVLGREGWILIKDADIAIRQKRLPFTPKKGNLYTPHRRILRQIPEEIPHEKQWNMNTRPTANEEFAGYFQLFHAQDTKLGPAPWHQTDWTWAGGADSFFNQKWPIRQKVRPPFEVLHIGLPFQNWAGRVSAFADGSVHEKAVERRVTATNLLKLRRQTTRGGKFTKEKIILPGE